MATPRIENNLTYAPLKATHKRWRLRSLLIVIILLALVSLARPQWWGMTWRRIDLLSVQHKCLGYTASPDSTIYDESPIRISGFRGKPDYTIDSGITEGNFGEMRAIFRPRCVAELDNRIPFSRPAHSRIRFCRGIGATAFLHERLTKHGLRRLVRVDCVHVNEGSFSFVDDYFCFCASTLEPSSFLGTPHWFYGPDPYDFHRLGSAWRVIGDRVPERIFAGQPDPADPSAFSIRCESGTRFWFVDGRLEDSDTGPVVRLAPRDTPP